MTIHSNSDVKVMIAAVEARLERLGHVGSDGTSDLRVIVETAMNEDGDVGADEIARIVIEARKDAQAERDAEVR